MRKISLIFLSIVASIQLYAQYNSYGGAVGFSFGYINMSNKTINEILPSHFQLDDHFISLGGEGYGMIKKFVLGGTGNAILGPGGNTDTSIVTFNGGSGLLNFGYAAYNSPRLKFIPLLGIGGVGMSLKVSQRKEVTLTDLQNNPLNETELNWRNFMFEIGFSLEYIFTKTDDDKSKGLRVALRAGYTFSPASNRWKYTGGNVTGMPKYMMNGVFARISIGGAFFANKKIEKK